MNQLGLPDLASGVKWMTAIGLSAGTVLGGQVSAPRYQTESGWPPRIERFTANIRLCEDFPLYGFATSDLQWAGGHVEPDPSFEDAAFLGSIDIVNNRKSGLARGYVVEKEAARPLPVDPDDLWWLG